jgi:hypothetical protein
MVDRYECQPADWADPPEREPDPEMIAEMWADKAPPGWQRCAKCGAEWANEDETNCECKT